jgi:hypothetical protein
MEGPHELTASMRECRAAVRSFIAVDRWASSFGLIHWTLRWTVIFDLWFLLSFVTF